MIRLQYWSLKIKEMDLTDFSVWMKCNQQQFDDLRLAIKILENKYSNEKIVLKDDFEVKIFDLFKQKLNITGD